MTQEERNRMDQMENDITAIKEFTSKLNRELFGDPEYQQPGLIEALRWVQIMKSRADSGAWAVGLIITFLSLMASIVYIIVNASDK